MYEGEESLRSSVSGPFVLPLYCSVSLVRLSREAVNGKSISNQYLQHGIGLDGLMTCSCEWNVSN